MLRVMLDTNILISSLFFPSITTFQFFSLLNSRVEIVLSDYVLVETPIKVPSEMIPHMRDAKDMPILIAAIGNHVDVLVSGDKDFWVLNLPAPRIMHMADFIKEHT